MSTTPIASVHALKNHVLRVEWHTGSVTLLNMEPKLRFNRFGPLKNEDIWQSAATDGRMIYWTDAQGFRYELAFNEVGELARGY